jgi:hypothetical protein
MMSHFIILMTKTVEHWEVFCDRKHSFANGFDPPKGNEKGNHCPQTTFAWIMTWLWEGLQNISNNFSFE